MKNFLLLFLFFASILVLVIGCGRTEDETQQRLEDLVGNWEFVSFGERSVDEVFTSLAEVLYGSGHHQQPKNNLSSLFYFLRLQL